MKHIKFPFRNVAALALIVTSFIACDKDFNSLGSDIIGENNFGTNSSKYNVIAYNKKLNPVQTNNLPINLLGIYKDQTYGLTSADIVSQVSMGILNPTFGENVILDSVVLTIPYFSRATGVNENGNITYQLDSVYGNSPMNLKIYENRYFLRTFDPNSSFDDPQKYFSDKSISSSNSIGTTELEGQLLHTELDFNPSNEQIILKDEDGDVSERLAPSLRLKLDTDYWKSKIIDQQGTPVLNNTNNFHNYFRGIYFKTETINDNGTMMLLNFASSSANITLYYTRDSAEGSSTDRIKATFSLNFTGNRVNFLTNDFNFPLIDGNSTDGDEKLFIKGGEGSIALIDLFNAEDIDSDPSSMNTFETFKNQFVETDGNGKFIRAKRLINEANLVFFVDQSLTQGSEPERIFLFDTKNNTVLFDYALDVTNTAQPNESKTIHLGKLQRENNSNNGLGIKYKIRITEHINNILLRDSSNVKLGLSVSANVNLENTILQRSILNDEQGIKKIPISSIVSPRGTVLYGNNTTNESKKVYLEIFYTEPNN